MEPTIKKRWIAGGFAAVLALGVGVAAGAATGVVTSQEDETTSSTSGRTVASTPSSSRPDDTSVVSGGGTETRQFLDVPDGGIQTFAAGGAGSVTIRRSGNTLAVVTATPNAGWFVDEQGQAADGHEVEVRFTNGNAAVRFDAEIEDGTVRIRVRQLGVADATTPTTLGDDHDNSGPGSSNRGPGSFDADDDHGDDHGGDDHDSSGPGGGGDDGPEDDHGSGGHGSDD